MKRKRRSFKWVGVTACAVLLCAWIGTFWSAFGYRAGTVVVDLSVGCFEVSVYPKGTPTQGWFAAWQPYEASWLPRRRVTIAGIAPIRAGQWMLSVVRNLIDGFDGYLQNKRFLLDGPDCGVTKYSIDL